MRADLIASRELFPPLVAHFPRPSPRFLGDIESKYDNERVFLGAGEGHKRINLLSQRGVWGGVLGGFGMKPAIFPIDDA